MTRSSYISIPDVKPKRGGSGGRGGRAAAGGGGGRGGIRSSLVRGGRGAGDPVAKATGKISAVTSRSAAFKEKRQMGAHAPPLPPAEPLVMKKEDENHGIEQKKKRNAVPWYAFTVRRDAVEREREEETQRQEQYEKKEVAISPKYRYDLVHPSWAPRRHQKRKEANEMQFRSLAVKIA